MNKFAIIGSEARSTTEAFGKALLELADNHPEVCALSADLAGSVKVTIMQKKYPERVFDVGIAEQNMMSMAAGLALGGLVPFAATFSVFASLRDLDQIHTDVCYQNANVKILGSHGGTSFSQAGSTHHALEDIAALRGFNFIEVRLQDGFHSLQRFTVFDTDVADRKGELIGHIDDLFQA